MARKKQRRLLIATDGANFFVRRIASVKRDAINNETVYTCDKPIGRYFPDLSSAVRKAKDVLSNPASWAWR